MSPLVGSEVSAYRVAPAPTGVPRVVRETHRHLEPLLAERSIGLVPMVTRPEQAEPPPSAGPYVADDLLLRKPVFLPENVDCALVLDPAAPIDFGRLDRARRDRGLPIVAMIHDVLPLTHPEWFLRGATRHYRVLMQQVLQVATDVVLPSHEVHSAVDALGWRLRARMHVIHEGTSFDQLPPVRSTAPRVDLIYVSTVEPRKGHATLIRAFDRLRAEDMDVTLTLVGRIGWESDELVALVQSHPEFGRRLTWRRHAIDGEVRDAMQRGAIAVMPTEGEGFGLFLEEALSSGVNVVATDLPVLRERRYPNVTLVQCTAEALASGIRHAAEEPPVALEPGVVRSMADFSRDLAAVIAEAVGSKRV